MSPKAYSYQVPEVRQSINDALSFMKERRETESSWKDDKTAAWGEAEWKLGSVIIAEGLLAFLYPRVALKSRGASVSLSDDIIDRDIQELLMLSRSKELHGMPYTSVPTSFTDVAALLLRAFSYFLSEQSGITNTLQNKYRDEVMKECNKLIDFLKQAAHEPKKATCSWAFTNLVVFKREKTGGLRLDTTYSSSIVLNALFDARNHLADILPSQRKEMDEIISAGMQGILECFDKDLALFSRNTTGQEKNVIHSIFALEGLLYCCEKVEKPLIEVPQEVIRPAVKKVVDTIGKDLSNLVSFDQTMMWQIAYVSNGKDNRLDLLNDRSTIGSIANVLCLSLRYLSPDTIEQTYDTLDALLKEFFQRRDAKTKVWNKDQISIYYTFRMVETLTNYLLYRSEDEISITRRQLAQALKKVLSSDDAVYSITDRLLKETRDIVAKQDFSDE